MISRLHLVLPDTLAAARNAASFAASNVVADWVGRGQRERCWQHDDLHHALLEPWQHAVVTVLPAALRAQGYASANLTRRGSGEDWQQGSSLHAEPLHLLAGLNTLTLLWPPPPDAAEAQELYDSLQPLVSVAGFELHYDAERQRWYLSCTRQFKWLTYSPRSGYSGPLQELMPRGDHAPELRRLMTEIQMLLHDHPVNQRRLRRGVPTINALWFWGDAPLELVSQPLPLHVISDEPYLKGLCEHLHQTCWPVPTDLATLRNSTALMGDLTEGLLVLRQSAQLATQLQIIDSWLVRADIRQLHVYLDHWRIDLQGGRWAQLLRRLRRPRSSDELWS